MDYLINVVVAARSYWMLAAVLYIGYKMIPQSFIEAQMGEAQQASFKKFMPRLAIFIFVAGTVLGIVSPSNTYKLTTDYNKTQDLRRIEQLNDSASSKPLVIQDISRQPSTVEDRATNAVDMRERVKVDLD